jgi:predicted CXXCH cytochrome family protein
MHSWLHALTLLLFLLLPNNSPFAASNPKEPLPEECEKCHNPFLEKELEKRYIHQPFADRKCLTCHVDPQDSSPVAEESSPAPLARAKIRWLDISPSVSVAHTFLLPAKNTSEKIVLEATAPGQSPLRQSLTIPPSDTLTKAKNDLTSPHITNIKADVQQGILLNAVISWQTDEKTNATVQYGSAGNGQTVEEKERFVTDHEIILPGLQSGATYQLAITCRDIFGNSTTSPLFTFSTLEIPPLPNSPAEKQRTVSEKIVITNSFFSINDKHIMLELAANQPVAIAIGISGAEPAERRISLEKSDHSADIAADHIPLTDKKVSSMTICATCHKGYNQQKSHPVNILPKGKTQIPPGYPTLPDGRISCMTCHCNHAADIEYRLIKSSRKELCLGCHPDKF